MKAIFLSFVITIALASFSSCQTVQPPINGSALITGKYWKLVALNGETVQPAEQMRREAHMILNSAEKRVNGNGSCNAFFGRYEVQGNNGISFSQMGATKMACEDAVMQVERRLFQAFEMTTNYILRNDSLLLTGTDMTPLARFVVSEKK